MELFEPSAYPLKPRRGNRVFPVSDRAVDIVDALCRFAKGAKIINASASDLIIENGSAKGVKTDVGDFSEKMYSWLREDFPIR